MFPTPIQKSSASVSLLYKISLPICLIIWLVPLLAVAITSVRSAGDITAGNYWGWPESFNLIENYQAVFENTPIGQYIWNSFKVTIPTVIGAVGLSCLTGFALAVYRFKSNIFVLFLFIAGNFIPFQILMVPVRDMTVQTGMYDTATGLILFHIAFQTGFCTFFMRNFISTLPFSLIEAPRIDGCGEFKIFLLIVMPLMKPAVAALAVLIFTFIWNDYFWATVLVQGNHIMPVTSGLKSLNGQWLAAWHLVSAGSILAALPPVKHFIAGLTLGANKG
ncbi:hypothetical protein CHS0354_013118 [Potamilus streckersoni]|uniref:ABC transmembrane type-1 domain-containing protein n=1 Tax=Potamilus streckersoni TaxID=2493646 RepID=A0AAE0VPV2_9BIVA|nr:hypothetical protein CHS0354_013118 [Potamilus streckersoni]